MNPPELSIIIVNWNTKPLLLKCLQSIEEHPASRFYEVLVVDNGSTDGSSEAVSERFPEVRLIQNGANLGFARANNIGINQSRGRYVCLMNSDVEVLEYCLDHLCEYLDENPSVGMVGPKVFWPDGRLQDTCRQFPSVRNNLCAALGLARYFRRSRWLSGEPMVYFPHDRIYRVDVLVGCFMMVRKKALNQVGLLDERFFIYAEDVDWCRRFRNAGWEVVFFPGARAIHHGRASSSRDPLRFSLEQQKAVLQYWEKHHGPFARALLKIILMMHHNFRIVSASIVFILRPSRKTEAARLIGGNLACLRYLFGGEIQKAGSH